MFLEGKLNVCLCISYINGHFIFFLNYAALKKTYTHILVHVLVISNRSISFG